MQHKKIYLQRLLAIYVAFFAVLLIALGHEVIPSFGYGQRTGNEMSDSMLREFGTEHPRSVYMLLDVPLRCDKPAEIAVADTLRRIAGMPTRITLTVSEPAQGTPSFASLAFNIIGGSKWIYALTLAGPLLYLVVIVLMLRIIHSVRRAIRDERPIGRGDVGRLRLIALLTIVSELLSRLWVWCMARRAATLLADTPYTVDTSFSLSYGIVLTGILLLFAAEVFAISRDLGEEQRLTI